MKRTRFLTFMMLPIFVVSCQKKSIVPETENEITTTVSGLGEKLENPYSLPNMKKAIQLLMSVAPQADYPDGNSLEPTHLYVRFLPKDQDDVLLLEKDSTLIYDPVPFGYEN
ncbi:hypothetical protein SMI01S_26460 [Sphingobacterium mizutaii NBRC 14946 = DSM 11724]|uniref:Uncharacterized protein n=2 Tax=Sphingobacterium mizutaii TaxID=1010 RepID=A0AAJ5BZR6_9SPHI|nr:hypothetical protein [Sphingobacterium mizutaii]GEM69040.1 hypothetical protein SMI01S_26460 [Sphingobacterium mizutaii NBRC 14946 = DSM 11724]SDK93044.1 hypothetical protein SAMN05192578_101384 [Sphingobacterium mizutaii]SNV48179.1 Uncharacterised protein [Sphingobacterium mizutaii]